MFKPKKLTTFQHTRTIVEWNMSKFFQRKPKLEPKNYEASWDQVGNSLHQSWTDLGFKIGIKQTPIIQQEENTMSPETTTKINAVVDSGVSAAKAVSTVAKETAVNTVSSVKDLSVNATNAVKLTALKTAIKVMPIAAAVQEKTTSLVSSGVEKSKQLWNKLTSKSTPENTPEPAPTETVLEPEIEEKDIPK